MKTLTAKKIRNCFCGLALILLSAGSVLAGDQTEKLRNEKVLVMEQTIAPGDTVSMPADRAGVVVYMGAGLIESTSSQGKLQTETVKRGDVVFRAPQTGPLKNADSGPLRVVWTGYLGNGSSETWGAAGLAPNYKLLFENQYGRVYDIKIAAGKYEPLHTHHNRVVVCLSGAELEHTLLDGRKEPATLKTDEIVWRRGVTHIGHNLGKTDLWAIAIEPK